MVENLCPDTFEPASRGAGHEPEHEMPQKLPKSHSIPSLA
jgi:hypothetical protein